MHNNMHHHWRLQKPVHFGLLIAAVVLILMLAFSRKTASSNGGADFELNSSTKPLLFSDGEISAEALLTRTPNSFSVHFLKNSLGEIQILPPYVTLTYVDLNLRLITVELRLLGIGSTILPDYFAIYDKSRAPMSSQNDSFIGLQIQIPWSKEKTSLLLPVPN